ncbi:methyltransferase-like protein 27 [Protopterus annectens]|uniref:methyltransferase-like protein 27 n=1 Tax=Protopterus annectens TaxID=7888 RepID=UPI001CF931B3|nr:methyltransferase-like protein 27 [Protopterus annectens]XP_043910101.1 methyltransferase-like protein 27 [Protopterus annectens]
MEDVTNSRTFSDAKKVLAFALKSTSAADKIKFYDSWASNYDQDVEIVEYRAPQLAVQSLVRHFPEERSNIQVLDVACGTGLVAAQLNKYGFGIIHGIDGSKTMLEQAKGKGLYQDLKQCMMGNEPLPVLTASYDAVIIVGALSEGHLPCSVIPELCRVTKPGGYICMTVLTSPSNITYWRQLQGMLKQLEQQGLWEQVDVQQVNEWMKAVSEEESTGSPYTSGIIYLYKKCTLRQSQQT